MQTSGLSSRSYSKETNSFPHSLESLNIFRKISQNAKMMDQQAIVSELLKSREKLELALTLTRTRREVRTNYGNHITTSNFIPRGQFQPNENHHGSLVSPVVSEINYKRNYNQGLSSYENDDDFVGRSDVEMGLSEFRELDTGHGTPVKASNQTIANFNEAKSDDGLSVIPLSRN